MATILGTLGVKLSALTAEFGKQMASAQAKLESFGKAAGSIAKVSGAGFAAMSGGIALAVKASSEQREAEIKLAAAAKATGQAIDVEHMKEYATQLQRTTTFGDEATLSTAALLTSFKLNQTQIKNLLPRLQDLSALYGVSLRQGALAVGRALEGSADSMSRFGVSLSTADKEAFKASGKAERLSFLLGELDRRAGGTAKALASTAAGAFQQFSNATGDVVQELGKLVDTKVGDGLRTLTNAALNVSNMIAGLNDETKDWLGNMALAATAALGAVTAITGLAAALPTLTAGFGTLAVAGKVIVAGFLLPLVKVGLILGVITAAVIGLKTLAPKAFSFIADSLVSLVKGVIKFYSMVVKAIGKIIRWIADTIGKSVVYWIGKIKGWSKEKISMNQEAWTTTLDDIAPNLKTDLSAAGKKLGEGAESAAKGLGGMFSNVAKRFGVDLAAGIEKAKGLLGDLGKGGSGPGKRKGAGGLGPSAGIGTGTKAGFDSKGVNTFGSGSGKVSDAVKEAITEVKEAGDGMAENILYVSTKITENAQGVEFTSASDEQASIKSAMGSIGESVLSNMEDFGKVVSATVQGFMQGGVAGGLTALFTQLAMRTESFGKIVSILGGSLGKLVAMVEPLVSALVPLIYAVGQLLDIVAIALTPIFQALDPVLMVLYQVLRGVALVIGGLLFVLGYVWNAIIDAIASVLNAIGKIPGLGFLKDWADDLKEAKTDTDSLKEALGNVIDTDFDDAKNRSYASQEATESTNEMSDSMNKATESLTNVPSGFKVALERFNASDAETPVGGNGSGNTYGVGGSSPIHIDEVNINSVQDGIEMFEKFQHMKDWENFSSSGSMQISTGSSALATVG